MIAGIIEAFVSPTGLAIPLKFAMAAALFVLLNIYLFGTGVGPDRRNTGQSDSAW